MSAAAIATLPEVTLAQISEQLALAVDRVMTEGSLYDRELAALAIKQARGDLIEAIFLVRAFRATLPRFGATEPVDTGTMQVRRRISSTFKDIPGGQILGPTFDYTHRLLDPQLAEGFVPEEPATSRGVDCGDAARHRHPRPRRPDRAVAAGRGRRRRSATSPASRSAFPPIAICACKISRAPTKASCSRSAIRRSAATAATIPSPARSASARSRSSSWPRMSALPCRSARSTLTECQMVNQFKGSATEAPCFTRGYGLAFGQSERKTMSMALVDRALRARELGEEVARAGAGRRVRDVAFRQCAGDRLRRASEAAALCRLPVRARPVAQAAQGVCRGERRAPSRCRRPRNERARPTTSPISTSRPSG